MFMKKVLILLLILVTLVGACKVSQQTATPRGILILKLTDHANLDYNKVLVTISQIEVHKDGNWTLFSEKEQAFDIIALENVAALLGQQQLEVGKYTQIRLLVTKAQAELKTNEMVDVTVPSNKIKLVRAFTIEANKTTELIIDFDPSSVKKSGPQYVMTPVIRILTPQEFEERVKQQKEKEEVSTKPENIRTTVPKNKEFTIELDDYGVYPNSIVVNKDDNVKITFKVRNNNVYYGGLDARSDYFDTGKIAPGESKTIEFKAINSFKFTTYWPSSGVVKSQGTVTAI